MLNFLKALVPKPVVPLPKLTTPSAADLAAKFKPQPPAAALLKPGMSSSEYVHALEANKMPNDTVNALAHGMPEKDSVSWACQSSRKVEGKLNAGDKSALDAAEAWVKNPNDATKSAAAAAAGKANMQGPGGWAAQAAAWSSPAPAAAVPGAAPAIAAPPLTAPAVAGAVLLAAGLMKAPPMKEVPRADPTKMPALPAVPGAQPPPPPEVPAPDQNKLAAMLQPFIDLGKTIAAG